MSRDVLVSGIVEAVRSVVRSQGPVPLHAPEFAGREREYLNDCIDTGWVSSVGAYVDRFERDLEALTGATRAVAVVNGTAALAGLPESARAAALSAFEHGFATLFLLAAGLAVVSLVMTLILKELPLRSARGAETGTA